MSIFDKIKKSDLADFLTLCKPYVDFDYEKAYNMALHAIKFNKGDKNSRNELRHLEELHVRWYDSLAKGSPDYSVYDDPYYGLCDVWACWVIYSRKYLLAINSPKSLTTKSIVSDMTVNSVIDMGNGFGYTTAGLKELFPSAKVYGFNLKDTCQYKVGEVLAPLYDFSMVSELPTTHIDIVFASEYFEHILDPVTHLLEVINKLSPNISLLLVPSAQKLLDISIRIITAIKNLQGKKLVVFLTILCVKRDTLNAQRICGITALLFGITNGSILPQHPSDLTKNSNNKASKI